MKKRPARPPHLDHHTVGARIDDIRTDRHIRVEGNGAADANQEALAAARVTTNEADGGTTEARDEGAKPTQLTHGLILPTATDEDASKYLGLPPGTLTWKDIDLQLRKRGSSLRQRLVEMGLATEAEDEGGDRG